MKFKWAEVRNIEDDPSQSGRVRIRSYETENDENECKDDDLPWAMPMQPTNSAGTSGIGIAPHGLVVGSRVLVGYMPEDTAEQFPIIMGSFSRAETPSAYGMQKGSDDQTGGGIKSGAPDSPTGKVSK